MLTNVAFISSTELENQLRVAGIYRRSDLQLMQAALTNIRSPQTGVYVGSLNALTFYAIGANEWEWYPEMVPGNGHADGYGVCDSLEQVLEAYREPFARPDRAFCVQLVEISPEDREENGGVWRWHKWGPYIGTRTRHSGRGEHSVFLFHIYEILSKERGEVAEA